MQTLPLDCFCLFNTALVFRTEADICTYLPCYQLLSVTNAYARHTLPYKMSCPTYHSFAFLSQPLFLCFLIHPTSPHLRCLCFPPLSSPIPHVFLYNNQRKFFRIPFSHFIGSLEVISSSYPLCYTLLCVATYVPLSQLQCFFNFRLRVLR